jgi:hypothetical protein
VLIKLISNTIESVKSFCSCNICSDSHNTDAIATVLCCSYKGPCKGCVKINSLLQKMLLGKYGTRYRHSTGSAIYRIPENVRKMWQVCRIIHCAERGKCLFAYIVKTYGGVEEQLHSLFDLAVAGDAISVLRPDRFTSWVETSGYENNQKDAIYRLIYYFKSALHVSGDVFAHHLEHLTVFTVYSSRHPSCCRHQPSATGVNTARYCKYSQVFLMMGENIARNM